MASFGEWLRSSLDWLERGDVLYRFLGAIGAGQALRAILLKYSHLDPVWIGPIWWIASAVCLWLLVWAGRAASRRKPTVIQTSPTPNPPTGSMDFRAIETFYQGHDSAFLREIEAAITAEAQRHQSPADRERFLTRGMTATLVMGFFEITWWLMFGSQIRALERLNKGVASIQELRPFYEQSLPQHPQYPFESWLIFLTSRILIRQDGNNVSITVRGREFLTWLVQNGKTASDKRF